MAPTRWPDREVPRRDDQRGIRLALESELPIAHIAHGGGMHPRTLRKKVRQFEADSGKRPDLSTSAEREEIRRLRQENYELRRANEILKLAIVEWIGWLNHTRLHSARRSPGARCWVCSDWSVMRPPLRWPLGRTRLGRRVRRGPLATGRRALETGGRTARSTSGPCLRRSAARRPHEDGRPVAQSIRRRHQHG